MLPLLLESLGSLCPPTSFGGPELLLLGALGGFAFASFGAPGALDLLLGGVAASLWPATLLGSGDLLFDLLEGALGAFCPAISLGGDEFLLPLGSVGADGAFELLLGSVCAAAAAAASGNAALLPEIAEGSAGAPLEDGALGNAG